MLWPAATWKDFRTLWGFVFRVIFLSSPCSVELKVVFGPVAPPIDYLRYRAFPRPSHSPLFLHQLFDQLLQPLDLLASCVPACICWRVWFDLAYVVHISTGVTGQATMQIKLSVQKQFFCFQYPRHGLTSDVVSLLSDSTCYYAFAIVVVVRIKKWMNVFLYCVIYVQLVRNPSTVQSELVFVRLCLLLVCNWIKNACQAKASIITALKLQTAK